MSDTCHPQILSPAQNENPSELEFIRLGRCPTASFDASGRAGYNNKVPCGQFGRTAWKE
jgi:hypothetical protein